MSLSGHENGHVNRGAVIEGFGGTAYATDPFLVSAVPLQTKPLPLEQLQLIQSFLHMVPQGRKMVDEVSQGAGGMGQWRGMHSSVGGVSSSPALHPS